MSDLLHALGIQWSALIAQMVNFALVLLILARFVYKPLLKTIDERRSLVAKSMKDVDEINRRMEVLDRERTIVLRKADEEAGKLMERAKMEAEALHIEIEKGARLQASQIIAKGKEQLEMERARVAHELQDKMARAIVKSAEKILRREFSKEDQTSFENELKENIPSMLT